jgi:hypothetical protein
MAPLYQPRERHLPARAPLPDLECAIIEDETPLLRPRVNRYRTVISIAPRYAEAGWALEYGVAVQKVGSARRDKVVPTAERAAAIAVERIGFRLGWHGLRTPKRRDRFGHIEHGWRYETIDSFAYAHLNVPVSWLVEDPVQRSVEIILRYGHFHQPRAVVLTPWLCSPTNSPSAHQPDVGRP